MQLSRVHVTPQTASMDTQDTPTRTPLPLALLSALPTTTLQQRVPTTIRQQRTLGDDEMLEETRLTKLRDEAADIMDKTCKVCIIWSCWEDLSYYV